MTACFRLKSAANTNQLLLQVPKEMKITGCKTGTVQRMIHNLPATMQLTVTVPIGSTLGAQ
jgi:hypothetical protein